MSIPAEEIEFDVGDEEAAAAEAESFAERVLGNLNDSALCLMLSIGHRTGLFEVMRATPPATTGELARRAGLQERYVSEWIGCAEDDIVRCFKEGGGVPYSRYAAFHEVIAEIRCRSVLRSFEAIVRRVAPDLFWKLTEGAKILDFGCGCGACIARQPARKARAFIIPKGESMATLRNLDDLFVHTLCRMYDAERRFTTTLPKMAEAANAVELKYALTWHLNQTKTHVDRLERVFGILNCAPKADTDEAARGIAKASQDAIDLDTGDSVKDAALIAAVQEADHYQIAAYGTLRTWAQVMNKPEAARLLEQTLAEAKKADQTLSAIAGGLNPQAASAP